MASHENQSLTAELLDAIREKSYDTCVSNLTKTHRVNLKKFRRERLPEGTWINTKRFMNNSNRPVADAMFSLFGEFSNQSGSEVRDTMIGWSYDNFRLLEGVFKVALDQRKITLRTWLEKMADVHTPGDELTLYVLSRMYRRHAYVYTQMFWWTTLLYNLPVTEQELVSQCEIVLVYVKDGIFGELDKIRSPAPTSAQMVAIQGQPKATSPLDADLRLDEPISTNEPEKTNPDITGSTSTERTNDHLEIVTPKSVGSPNEVVDVSTDPSCAVAAEKPKIVTVITENVKPNEAPIAKSVAVEITGRPKASLPGIGVFLDKTCTIPLVRCDFDTIKTTVESRDGGTKCENTQNPSNPTARSDPGSPTLRTSSRKCTVIDYKKFLQEFADLPPSPPKRKREIDLKRKPSKSRIAAEKYRKTDFATKPSNIPKPVRRRVRAPESTPSTLTDTNTNKDVSRAQETIMKPTTPQETQDAIEALLLLGTMGMPPPPLEDNADGNAVVMPIGANRATDDSDVTNSVPKRASTDLNPPKPGTVLGVAVKTDTDGELFKPQNQERNKRNGYDENENKERQPKPSAKEDNKNKKGNDNKKKTFVTRQFGLKRRNRPRRKFKCEKCAQELNTVHDYNQHYLDNHPPTPCPYCPHLFTSLRTMAKHKYSHAEVMYECETCGQGFTFRSQYISHRKVHLTIQGYVCFKAKCGQRFKRESELNAHLKAHDSKPIKCEHCDYTNKDQRNVRAHMRIHSEKLPFFCILCGKRFRWQEQKRRHIPNCTGD